MKSLVIVVEFRPPRTKEEAGLYGLTVTENERVARVFINSRKEPGSRLDTFFHEVAHAFMHWKGEKDGRKAEKAARLTGEAVNEVFKGVFK